jgi:DNA-binding response OmpR family regulator
LLDKDMLILVVEDETLVAFALEWALKIVGHRVLGPADSVEDAITLCRNDRPDVALIDLNLRDGGDGVEVARFLHERHRTPCLFLSAQVAHARAHRHLAVGLVRKPYDSARLPAIVKFVARPGYGRMSGQLPAGLELYEPDER